MHRANREIGAPRTSIAVFARAPVPGAVKTRLTPRLGADGAAMLQSILTRHTLHTALNAGIGEPSLWCTPDCGHPMFRNCHREYGVRVLPQRGADLGARMLDAFERLCVAGSTLLVGTDCPALTSDALQAAAVALADGDDAVFIPAEDGGYVLAGLRRPCASLFHRIEWGSPDVMDATRERLRHAGMRWRELPALWDVDRPEDVDRLLRSGLIPLDDLSSDVAAAPRP
ncbi:MAG: TIGR04282 family arsenosugar biosynthesis glycosyltransferase [Betaproteobacteria bacterium]|nr:TIGR04282 family arsenosugar biosynthesis glycosyltransferase [Betaproteobacteria bacterium]